MTGEMSQFNLFEVLASVNRIDTTSASSSVTHICSDPSEFYISNITASLTLSRNLAKTNSMNAFALG